MASAGFNSGAHVGIWNTRNHSLCSSANSFICGHTCTFRLSQHHTSGACNCWRAARIKSRSWCQTKLLGPLRPCQTCGCRRSAGSRQGESRPRRPH